MSINSTIVNGRVVDGSASERHHLERVLAEKGSIPCGCVEWSDSVVTPPSRTLMGFRNWTTKYNCELCGGFGSMEATDV